MSLRRFATGWSMSVRELARRRIAILMFFLIPALFYTLIELTTSKLPIPFKLASVSEDTFIQVSARDESLIFIGLASVGLLSSFLALNLVQSGVPVYRRLVLCGYRPWEIIAAKLATLLVVAVLVGVYVAAMATYFFEPRHFGTMAAGFVLCGWVYGCYGLLIGALFRRELEGILFIVLLVNIDAAWLQNPLYYAGAQRTAIIRSLPAYFPSQVSMVAAFTTEPVGRSVLQAFAYGAALLLAALLIYRLRMQVRPARG